MSRKKLLLIIPPQKGLLKGFATGIVSLAEYLYLKKSEINTDIEILDFSLLYPDEVKIQTLDYSRSENLIVGITTTTASYQSALYVAKNFKKSNPNCTVILGGHHASADTDTILRNHSGLVDFIISGEGEVALYEFVRDFPLVGDASNLVYLKNNQIVRNKIAPLLSENHLDKISLSYKETELYGHAGKFDTITYVSARGCPLKCSFCAVANQKMRAKSVLQVKADLKKLLKLGFNTIAIEDNFFAHSPTRTFELSRQLGTLKQTSPLFRWDCQTRVESLKNPEIIKAMEDGGCYAAYVGVEALNDEHLIYLGKTKNPEHYLQVLTETVVPNMLASNIDSYINLQFGIPGSTKNHHNQALSHLKKIGLMASKKGKAITVFPQLHVVYPGTQHHIEGTISKRFSRDIFESFTKWEVQQNNLYGWMGENFAHGTGGIPEGILERSLLAKSRFSVEHERVLQIQNELADIKKLRGIKIFEYKKFLV